MKEQLEAAAKALNQTIGKNNLTKEKVCERANVRPGSFGYLTGMTFGFWIESLDLPDTEHVREGRRLAREERVNQLLKAGMKLAKQFGYQKVSRGDVADLIGVSPELVTHYFGSSESLQDAIMVEALETFTYRVIAQGLANQHPLAMGAPADLRTEAIRIGLQS